MQLIKKDRLKTILGVAVPIAVGLISTYIMLFIDIVMIKSLGNAALAAVGYAGVSYELVFAFVVGATPAVRGIVARRLGEQSNEATCLPLNAGLLLVIALAIPVSLLLIYCAPLYFSLVTNDALVAQEGIPYLQAMLVALVAHGMSDIFKGFWTGVNRVKVYMLILLMVNCLNVLFNYLFIFGNWGAPKLGTQGAGIASAIAITIGMLTYMLVTFMRYRGAGFLNILPTKKLFFQLIKMGLPVSVQGILFSLGSIALFWMVGLIGTSEAAAVTVLIRVTTIMLIFAMALGHTSAMLVSNTVGKGDLDDATQWGWDIGQLGFVWITLLGIPLLIFPEAFLSLFITDLATIQMATIPLMLTAITTGIIGLSYIYANTLFSLGDGRRVVMVSFVTRWVFFLPAVWIIGPYLKYGLLEVWIAQMIYGVVTAWIVVSMFRDGRWKSIKI
ncbi:MATE family efflux transporter [Aliikangiella maris]|uniref:MATE family efflux transporter n=2 Tax=Aliikangiella maris TaxID=3162458 RepID=A0ABV2BXW5_9GAMM